MSKTLNSFISEMNTIRQTIREIAETIITYRVLVEAKEGNIFELQVQNVYARFDKQIVLEALRKTSDQKQQEIKPRMVSLGLNLDQEIQAILNENDKKKTPIPVN